MSHSSTRTNPDAIIARITSMRSATFYATISTIALATFSCSGTQRQLTDHKDACAASGLVTETLELYRSIDVDYYFLLMNRKPEVSEADVKSEQFNFARNLPILEFVQAAPLEYVLDDTWAPAGFDSTRARELVTILTGAASYALADEQVDKGAQMLLASLFLCKLMPRGVDRNELIAYGATWQSTLKALEENQRLLGSADDALLKRIFRTLVQQSFTEDLTRHIASSDTPTVDQQQQHAAWVLAPNILGTNEWCLFASTYRPLPTIAHAEDRPHAAKPNSPLGGLGRYAIALEYCRALDVRSRLGGIALLLEDHRSEYGVYPTDGALLETHGLLLVDPTTNARIGYSLSNDGGFALETNVIWPNGQLVQWTVAGG